MSASVSIRAPAKLNLTLEVVERLPTGYHKIRSVYVKLDAVADTIELWLDSARDGINITADSAKIPLDASNVCHQAAEQYLDSVDATARVDIRIQKAIPVSAGLGGGSSDAAAVLLGLNQYFDNALPADDLALIGSRVGKDVPFFLTRAAAARVSGLGEAVEPLAHFPDIRFLIVNPGIPVSTKAAYEALAANVPFMADTDRVDVTSVMALAIASGDHRAVTAGLYNDFEALVERQHPIVKELKQALIAFGAVGALMSGSGPSVFGLFESDDLRIGAEKALRRHYPSFFIRSA